MKKTIRKFCILFLLPFLLPAASYAQLVHWGISAGTILPYNTEAFNNQYHFSKTSNYNVGFQLKVGSRIHGQSGINYYINNNKVTETAIDSSAELKNNYLGIPVMLGINLIDQASFKFRITGGLEYRALIWVSPNDLSIEKSDLTTNNADMFGGVGLNIGKLSLDIMCKHPFTPVIKDADKEKISCWLNIGFFF